MFSFLKILLGNFFTADAIGVSKKMEKNVDPKNMKTMPSKFAQNWLSNFFLCTGLAAQIDQNQKSHATTSRTGYLDLICLSFKSQEKIILYFFNFALQKSILDINSQEIPIFTTKPR